MEVGLGSDEGGEAGVDEGMEGLGDGVERDEGVEGQVFCEFEG